VLTVRPRVAASLCLALCLSAGWLPTAAAEDDSPEVATGTILAAKTYPGIQLVETIYSARISVRIPEINNAAFDALVARLVAQAQTGVIGTTEASFLEAIVAEIEADPGAYLTRTGPVVSDPAQLSGTGTGWVVTPNGYVVTAAHVVSSDRQELKQAFADSTLADLTDDFVQGLTSSGSQFTPKQVQRLTESVLGWLALGMRVDNLEKEAKVHLAEGIDGQGKRQEAVDAKIVDVGEPYPGNDVALLKIDGIDNLPTLPLGADDDVSAGSTLHVVGFPGASTFSPAFSRDAQAQPTVTEGPLTAIKSTEEGMPVFQTQAPASPGNSGGPVLNDTADVVGMLVASAVGDDGVALEGQEFVIPVSVVEEMLADNEVEPEQGKTTKAYSEAIDEFYVKHYKAALPLFKEAAELYPKHPYVDEFIDDSSGAIADGEDETPAPKAKPKSGISGLVIALSVGILILLGLLALAGFLLLRFRKPGTTTPGTAPPMPTVATPTAAPAMVPTPAVSTPAPAPSSYGEAPGQHDPGVNEPVVDEPVAQDSAHHDGTNQTEPIGIQLSQADQSYGDTAPQEWDADDLTQRRPAPRSEPPAPYHGQPPPPPA
jgi:serine protease Do